MAVVKLDSPYQELANPPSVRWSISDPIYYFENNTNYVFMVTMSGLWKYNLDQQTIEEKYEYSEDILSIHNDGIACLDERNKILYFLFEFCYLASFNLLTKQWTLLSEDPSEALANITFIQSPIHQLHVTMDNRHFRFDESNKSFILLSNNTGSEKEIIYGNDERAKYVYCTKQSRLLMFQGGCKHIQFCDINSQKQQSTVWRKYDIELPYALETTPTYSVVLAWDQILFIFYYFVGPQGSVQCLDLLHNQKWFVSAALPDCDAPAQHAIKDSHNNIHLLTVSTELYQVNNIKPAHFVASLYDLVPSEIIALNRNMYDPLVIGYIKKCEKHKWSPFIPVHLKNLILRFYPLFL